MFWCRCPRRQSAECERGLKCTVMIKCFTLTTVVSHMHKLVTSDFVSPLFKYSVNILVINRKTRHEPHCRVFPFFAYLSHVTFFFFFLFSSAFTLREDKQNRWHWLNINWRENGNVCCTFVLFVPLLYKSSMFVPVADSHVKHHLSQCEFASNTCELEALITVLQLWLLSAPDMVVIEHRSQTYLLHKPSVLRRQPIRRKLD